MNQKRGFIYKRIAVSLIAGVLFGAIFLLGLFSDWDDLIKDYYYQNPTVVDSDIVIVAIDEKTTQELGIYTDWTRATMAELITKLNSDTNMQPAVIGIDILYIANRDTKGDEALCQACKIKDNVVLGSYLLFEDKIIYDNQGNAQIDKFYVSESEMPYKDILPYVETGFANTLQDSDSYIRKAIAYKEVNGETQESFAMAVYRNYSEYNNENYIVPKSEKNGTFSFLYSGNPGDYNVISMIDIIDGTVSSELFKGKIVLIGAYSAGMMDNYNVPIERNEQMYGVEIHANIVQALIEGKIVFPVNEVLYSLIIVLVGFLFVFTTWNCKLRNLIVLSIVFLLVHFSLGKIFLKAGWQMPLLMVLIAIISLGVFNIGTKYVVERINKKTVLDTFKKYVAPQIVEDMAKNSNYNVKIGGEKKSVAVLFADIRGFTTLSEKLPPEQVVMILNRCLEVITKAILQNGGTLDKYIGDAAMAVFNSPFTTEDYIYKAVITGLDISKGIAEIETELSAQFHESIGVGVGINCGDAIIGNIGCEFRMDYTAIGDTVNTAARLESKAQKGQVLISYQVYESIKERIIAESMGTVSLKGKTNAVMVYDVKGLKGNK